MQRRLDGVAGLLAIVVAIIVIASMAYATSIVSWLMMSAFFAILVRPLHVALLRRGVPTALSLAMVALLLVGVVAGLAVLVSVSVSQMVAKAPTYQEGLSNQLAEMRATLDALGMPAPSRTLTDLIEPGALIGAFISLLGSLGRLVFDLFYILLLVMFLLVDGAAMMGRMRAGLGEDHPVGMRLSQVGPKVVRYFGIRAYINFLTGAGFAAALWLIGIDYALLWGTLMFFFSFVPYIGITLASVPPVLLALIELGPAYALLVIVGITVINLTLENVVMPRMIGTSLSITPTVVLVSFSFWTWLLGGSGALLSVFLTILAIVFLDSFDRTRWIAGIMTGGGSTADDAVEPVPDGATVNRKTPA